MQEQGGLITLDDLANWQPKRRGAAQHQLPRHRRLQARRLDAGPGAAAVAEHPRELRPARDGLQQRALHPHALPGDEPRLRRPRLLLRRPGVPAGGADPGAAVEGVREAARGDDQTGSQRRRRRARAIPIRSRAARIPYARPAAASSAPPRSRPAIDAGTDRAATSSASSRASARGTTSVVAADAEGLARLGHAERRLDPGRRSPAAPASASASACSPSCSTPPRIRSTSIEPGKRPRVTLTPSLALRDGKPWLAFAVQGGDTQDQNLLQFFLNVVEFGMTPQEAVEAANFNSYQMKASFDQHESQPGRILLNASTPQWVSNELALPRLHAGVRAAHLRARSTRSCSTPRTAASGAARATTARTTASAGEDALDGRTAVSRCDRSGTAGRRTTASRSRRRQRLPSAASRSSGPRHCLVPSAE